VAGVSQVEAGQFDRQYDSALQELASTQQKLRSAFFEQIKNMDNEIDAALQQVQQRREEMDKYVAARAAMAQYSEQVKALVAKPGNALMKFIREETALHLYLTKELEGINAEYRRRYEEFSRTAASLELKNNLALEPELLALVEKMVESSKLLEQRTEEIQTALQQYMVKPEEVDALFKRLQKLKTMAARELAPRAGKIRQYRSMVDALDNEASGLEQKIRKAEDNARQEREKQEAKAKKEAERVAEEAATMKRKKSELQLGLRAKSDEQTQEQK